MDTPNLCNSIGKIIVNHQTCGYGSFGLSINDIWESKVAKQMWSLTGFQCGPITKRCLFDRGSQQLSIQIIQVYESPFGGVWGISMMDMGWKFRPLLAKHPIWIMPTFKLVNYYCKSYRQILLFSPLVPHDVWSDTNLIQWLAKERPTQNDT